MGFTCGIYKINKSFRDFKNVTAQDELDLFEYTRRYFEAKRYDWENEAKEYEEKLVKNSPNHNFRLQELVDIIKTNNPCVDTYEYNSIEDWCSNGATLHDIVMSVTSGSNEYHRVLTRDDIKNVLIKLYELIETKFVLEQVSLSRAFQTKEEDDEEISIYRKVDGIEVEFDDNTKKDIYSTDYFDESELYTSKKYFDNANYIGVAQAIKCLTFVLCDVDFNNEIVYYCGGW